MRRRLHGFRRHSDGHNAARLDDVQAELLGGGDHLVGFGAGVQPEFVAAAGGDVGQEFQKDWRRDVDADHVRTRGDVPDALIRGQAFDLGLAGVDGIDGITLKAKGAHGLVAKLGAVAGGADHGDGLRLHPQSI